MPGMIPDRDFLEHMGEAVRFGEANRGSWELPAPTVWPVLGGNILSGRLTSDLLGVNTVGNTGTIPASSGATFQAYAGKHSTGQTATGPVLTIYPPEDLYSGYKVASGTFAIVGMIGGEWVWLVGECPVAV